MRDVKVRVFSECSTVRVAGALRRARCGAPRVPVWRPAFQAGASSCRAGGWWSLRLRHRAELPTATPPASGGLCRLKPAFQTVRVTARSRR